MSSHPQRYPHHADPLKGQVFGGECNRTACERHGATWWNMGTFGFYCPEDAYHINRAGPLVRTPLCVEVTEKPAVEAMEQFRRDHGYYE
jgi:hypothetical protein